MRLILFLATILSCFPLAAQDSLSTWSIKGVFDRFTTDELGNIYALQGDVLTLYDPNGKQLARNSLNIFGKIARIDAFSSLKPLIFSRAQGQLALLDNTLSFQVNPIDLPSNGFPQVSLACMSVQNRYWFFDERRLALIRVDPQLQPVADSGRLDQLLGFTPQPTWMVESEGEVFMVDPLHGILVFDLFGSFARTLPLTGIDRIQVRNKTIWYVRDGQLERYHQRLLTNEVVPWPSPTDTLPVLDVRIEMRHLYRLLPDRIVIDLLVE